MREGEREDAKERERKRARERAQVYVYIHICIYVYIHTPSFFVDRNLDDLFHDLGHAAHVNAPCQMYERVIAHVYVYVCMLCIPELACCCIL